MIKMTDLLEQVVLKLYERRKKKEGSDSGEEKEVEVTKRVPLKKGRKKKEETADDDDTETVSVREPATPEAPYGRLVKTQVKKDKRSAMQSTQDKKEKPKHLGPRLTGAHRTGYKTDMKSAKTEFDKWDAERKVKEKNKKEKQAQAMSKKTKKSGGTPPQQS